MKDSALILMTRVPLPGRTKTRLETHLTQEQCAKLHTCFLIDIYNTAAKTMSDVYVFYTPEKYKNIMEDILGKEAHLKHQYGMSLGERMFNAIENCLGMGYKKCVLIGTDIPTINEDILSSAFEKLDSTDVVIGPTEDGGYYLIGMSNPIWEVFDNTFYGTGTVYESTLNNMKNSGISYSTVDTWYDIDTYEDIKHLAKCINESNTNAPYHTYNFLCETGIIPIEKELESSVYGNFLI